MSGLLIIAGVAAALAILPFALTAVNLVAYRRPIEAAPLGTAISVLIPARNEASNIGAALDSVLAARDVVLEVLIGDDASQDDTARIVAKRAQTDPRVRFVSIPPLPAGWSGKQHTCWILAQRAIPAPVVHGCGCTAGARRS